jgi:hypothetical protein
MIFSIKWREETRFPTFERRAVVTNRRDVIIRNDERRRELLPYTCPCCCRCCCVAARRCGRRHDGDRAEGGHVVGGGAGHVRVWGGRERAVLGERSALLDSGAAA